MSEPITSIAIIGGGTAGWLTAAVVAAHHKTSEAPGLKVTLVESSDIPTVGVGEGTWPTMKNTIQRTGIKEQQLFKHCHAAFKQGGKFVDWVHGDGDYYYHPFTVPLGYNRLDLAPYVDDIEKFAQVTNFQHHICEAGLAPRSLTEGEYQGQANYAYHLDAGAFANLLKQHCIDELGVEHLVATVESVELSEDGGIASVGLGACGSAGAPQSLSAGLFVDCTGFRSLLLGETLGVEFLSKDEFLFNDSALAMQVPYESAEAPLASHTIATAQNAGWIWDIGLPHRRGVGHVYDSRFLSDDEAASNLQRYLGLAAHHIEPRKIAFKSGHRAEFWRKNCVAVGLSAGFVEPLEATAIMLVEISARFIAENLQPDPTLMPIVAKRFNGQMRYRWRRIIDFLKLHYMLTKRQEPYWRAHTANESIPESLHEDLAIWNSRGPLVSDFEGAAELFPAASYQYVMYGMGFAPNFDAQSYLYRDTQLAQRIFQQNQQLTQQMLTSLPPHRQYINRWLASTA